MTKRRFSTNTVFTADDLDAVCRWLEMRHEYLHDEALTIEAGDDFAHSNGKWPTIQHLRSESQAAKRSFETAFDQLKEIDDPEYWGKYWGKEYAEN